MVTLTTRSWRAGETTVVACRLTNDADEPRVALLDSRSDEPAHVAAAYRSEEATLRVTVPAAGTVGTGFTTAAEPTEPAVELVAERPPSSPHPDAVLADLSEPRPPHEAVVADETTGRTADRPCVSADGRDDTEARTTVRGDATGLLDTVERRLERLEAVAAATTVPEAADALAREGGLDAVRRLDAQVRADRDRLTGLAERASTLAGRAEAVEPQIETLDRLS